MAAVCDRSLRAWLQQTPGVIYHHIAPLGLAQLQIALQIALATMMHFIELSTAMGVQPPPLLRDCVCYILEDAFQLSGGTE